MVELAIFTENFPFDDVNLIQWPEYQRIGKINKFRETGAMGV